MPGETVIELAERFRAALLRRDKAVVRRVIDAYLQIARRLTAHKDALILEIEAMEEPTKAKVRKLGRYGGLLEDVIGELTASQGFAQTELTTSARQAIELGKKHANLLATTGIGEVGVLAETGRLPTKAIETMLAFLDPSGPLFKRLGGMLPGVPAQRIADALLEGVALGKNPVTIARILHNELGMERTDAMRITHTAQLWVYREASRANWGANSDVVRGWTWMARLDDPKTCMACIAMHGTEHPLDKPLNDHHNGHCTALPLIYGRPNPLEETGEDWFRKLDETKQIELMGKGRHEAWKAGKFEFGDLVGSYTDDVYGKMRSEVPVEDLVTE